MATTVPRRQPSLLDCIAQFEDDLHDLAWNLALAIIAQELKARSAAPGPLAHSRPPRTRGRRTPRQREESGQQTLPGIDLVALAANTPAQEPSPAAATTATTGVATMGADSQAAEATPSKSIPRTVPHAPRPPWTRERVVTELAQWLLEEPTIDAATLVRRRQASLVAAARRIFGRFDAALNNANLHLARLYPDGPPKPGYAQVR